MELTDLDDSQNGIINKYTKNAVTRNSELSLEINLFLAKVFERLIQGIYSQE